MFSLHHCDIMVSWAYRGQRVIYTTPLKALSNQKLFEMRERFGTDRVGLSTGDASIQTDSAIMIMTTEILRNIMYRTEEETEDKSTNRDALADVGIVVLDEVSVNPHRGLNTARGHEVTGSLMHDLSPNLRWHLWQYMWQYCI